MQQENDDSDHEDDDQNKGDRSTNESCCCISQGHVEHKSRMGNLAGGEIERVIETATASVV